MSADCGFTASCSAVVLRVTAVVCIFLERKTGSTSLEARGGGCGVVWPDSGGMIVGLESNGIRVWIRDVSVCTQRIFSGMNY